MLVCRSEILILIYRLFDASFLSEIRGVMSDTSFIMNQSEESSNGCDSDA